MECWRTAGRPLQQLTLHIWNTRPIFGLLRLLADKLTDLPRNP
jgi:hypothetical protein